MLLHTVFFRLLGQSITGMQNCKLLQDVNPPIESKFSCDILASIGRCKSHDSLQFCIPSLDQASNLIKQGEQQAVLHRCQIHVRFHEPYMYYLTVKHNNSQLIALPEMQRIHNMCILLLLWTLDLNRWKFLSHLLKSALPPFPLKDIPTQRLISINQLLSGCILLRKWWQMSCIGTKCGFL